MKDFDWKSLVVNTVRVILVALLTWIGSETANNSKEIKEINLQLANENSNFTVLVKEII